MRREPVAGDLTNEQNDLQFATRSYGSREFEIAPPDNVRLTTAPESKRITRPESSAVLIDDRMFLDVAVDFMEEYSDVFARLAK